MKTKHLRLMQRAYVILFFCFMYLPIAYMTAEMRATSSETRKALRMAELWSRLVYHLRVKPVNSA